MGVFRMDSIKQKTSRRFSILKSKAGRQHHEPLEPLQSWMRKGCFHQQKWTDQKGKTKVRPKDIESPPWLWSKRTVYFFWLGVVLGGSSQSASGWDGIPFISQNVRPFGRGPTSQVRGRKRSPWLLTTYVSVRPGMILQAISSQHSRRKTKKRQLQSNAWKKSCTL